MDFIFVSWRDYLLACEQYNIEQCRTSSTFGADVMSNCLDSMQAKFPGKYTLIWVQTAPMEYHLDIHFEDPKQEMMWKIQFDT